MRQYSSHLVVIVILGFISLATSTEVSQCIRGEPLPIFASVEGCDVQPCIIYNGVGANMNITFRSLSNTRTLRPGVRATLGITINYPLEPALQNACNWLLNGYCPIEKDEVLVYTLSMPMNYPAVTVTLEFSLIADNDEVFQCFRIVASVRNPTQIQIEGH